MSKAAGDKRESISIVGLTNIENDINVKRFSCTGNTTINNTLDALTVEINGNLLVNTIRASRICISGNVGVKENITFDEDLVCNGVIKVDKM